MSVSGDTRVFKVSTPLTAQGRADIVECARILKQGGLVAFPTETVYGLGALAEDGDAVRRIFEAKGRPQDNPLIVHVAEFSEVERLAGHVPPVARRLADAFWPGPLSMVLPSSSAVPLAVTAGLDTVAIRMPDNEVALELIRRAGPIAAPSANSSGRPSPTRAEHVYADLAGRIDAIIDAGPTGVGLESTVLDLQADPPAILRPGGATYEQLRALLPDVARHSAGHSDRPRSPGQKYIHYSPKAPVVLVKGNDAVAVSWKVVELVNDLLRSGQRVGVLATSESEQLYRELFEECESTGRVRILRAGARSNPSEIAARLFDALRQFDHTGVDTILAEGIQETDIGVAVMDRLGRAATQIVDATANFLDVAAKHVAHPFHVLFVCTGNTCRSPMAEVIARAAAERSGLGGRVVFSSAGVTAFDGDRATDHARAAAREMGLELGAHVARRLSGEIARQADLILTMTPGHKAEVIRRFPEAFFKTHTLGEYTGDAVHQVDDPFGCSLEAYRRTADALEELDESLIARLKAGLAGRDDVSDGSPGG